MSLILRTTLQDHLNNYGLGDYHIRIDGNQNLSIAAECGKPFVTVQGIQFASGRPTKAEINAANDLLEEFILTHRETIKATIVAKSNVAKYPQLTIEDLEALDFTSRYNGIDKSIEWQDSMVNWRFDMTSGELESLSLEGLSTPAQLSAYKFDKTRLATAKKFAKQFNKASIMQKALATQITTLTSCDI